MARTAQVGREEEILDAALREFARHGYAGARMSAIAEAAGVADGTVYLYAPSKQELLLAAFRRGFDGYLEALDGCVGSLPDPEQAICALIAFHLEYLASRPDLARVAQVELRQPDAALRARVQDVVAPYLRRLDALIGEGRRLGRFRADVDPRTVRNWLFGALDQCVSAWVGARHPYPLDGVADDLGRLVLAGLRA